MAKFKRLLAILLSFAVLVSGLVVTSTVSAADEEQEKIKSWSGDISTPSDSDHDGVYEINTPEELAYIASGNGGGKSYILTADIYINDPAAVDWATGAINEGYSPKEWYEDTTFNGKLNGDGHTVYGIWYPQGNNEGSSVNYVGLFPKTGTNTTIEQLAIKNSYLETVGFAGAFVGFLTGMTEANILIDNCYSDDTVTIKSYKYSSSSTKFASGGILGAFYSVGNLTISNCYSLANVDGANKTRCNLIIGDIWKSSGNVTMKNCYAYGGKPCPGTNANTTIDSFVNVYSTAAKVVEFGEWTTISAANMTGSNASTYMPGLGNAFAIASGTPTLEKFVEYDESIWSGFPSSGANSGTGTAEDPYVITNGEELAWAINNASKLDNHHFKLTNDIYLNDISKINFSTGKVDEGYVARSWYQDTDVKGTFSADGKVVYGLYFNVTPGTAWGVDGAVALFPRILDGSTLNISGIGVDYAYISASKNASAFVGSNSISDSTINSIINISESYSGENVTLNSYLTASVLAACRGVTVNIIDFYALDSQTCNTTKGNMGIVADDWTGGAYCDRVYRATGPLSTKETSIKAAENSYTISGGAKGTIVSANNMKGKRALINMAGLGSKFVTTDTYPVLSIFLDDIDENVNIPIGAPLFNGGGTEEEPYLISTAEDLRYMVGVGGNGAYYKLTNDIYVNDVNAVDWLTGTVNGGYEPEKWFIGNNEKATGYISYVDTNDAFDGTIDGNGYAIHGLYYELGNNSTVGGLIPYANNVTFINLGIEDSFIGSGRFTGGFVGYGKTINLSGCYVDDSCAVFGWDAGADYVDDLSDIGDKAGSGLCQGTIDSDTNALSDVYFTSTALGGFVGRYITGGAIENCYVTANVKSNPIFAFGKEGQGVTFAAPGTNGGGMGHIGGLWGDDYNATVSATDCFSVIKAHESNGFDATKTKFTDVYTLADGSASGVTKVSLAVGDKGLDEMTGLDTSVWYAVKHSTDYPQLRLRGTAIGDVDENGKGAESSDLSVLRQTLINTDSAINTDTNRDNVTNICDLVALSVKAAAKAAADAEAKAALLDAVYLSANGYDANVGTADFPVATLNKAVALAKDGAEVIVDGIVAVNSVPTTEKTVTVKGGTLDFSGASTLNVNTGLIFAEDSGVKFAEGSTVYANGNTVVINEGTAVEGIPAAIYGGGNNPVAETNLTLKAGSYKVIYGGGNSGVVLGDTNLTLAGTVNSGLTFNAAGVSYIYGGSNTGKVYGNTNVTVKGSVNAANLDHTSHTAMARLYGGSKNGAVGGSTFVTVAENAEFNYIYGGCASGTVGKATNIDFSGYTMAIYGGSGTITETNVTVNGGWVHQVFGGCEGSSMTGNTNVTIKGGYIDRRIVGGCYNNFAKKGDSIFSGYEWKSENYVTGTCTVTLYDEATYNLEGDDHGITALSRHGTNHTAENGVMIFENQTLYNNLKNDLGISIILDSVPKYDSYSIAQ